MKIIRTANYSKIKIAQKQEVVDFIEQFENIFTTPSSLPSNHTKANEFADNFAREDILRAKRIAAGLRRNANILSEREPNGRPPSAIIAIAEIIERRIRLLENEYQTLKDNREKNENYKNSKF